MKANMMDLRKELLLKKGEDKYIRRRKELEKELTEVFNEAIANGSSIAEEVGELLESLCESAVHAQIIFNIITGQEEFNTIEEVTTTTTDSLKKTLQEAIDKGSDLESEVRELIEAIALFETDIAIMVNYVVEKDLGLDVAMKVLFTTI